VATVERERKARYPPNLNSEGCANMGVRTRSLDIAATIRREAANRAKYDEAVRVVEHWSAAMSLVATCLVADDPRRHRRRNSTARLLSRLPHQPVVSTCGRSIGTHWLLLAVFGLRCKLGVAGRRHWATAAGAHAFDAPPGHKERNRSCENSSSLRPQWLPYSHRQRSSRAKAQRRSRISPAYGAILTGPASSRRHQGPVRW
jgi:hypothetical protein